MAEEAMTPARAGQERLGRGRCRRAVPQFLIERRA